VQRSTAIFVFFSVFLAACSSADIGSAVGPETNTAERVLLRCLSDAGFSERAIVVEQKFSEMQQIIREDGAEALDEQQTTMFTALQEPTVIDFGISYVDYLGPAYTPGETTMAELRRDAGLLEVLDFSSLVADLWDAEWLALDYRIPLEEECDANNSSALASICDRGVSEACRDQEKYADRDLEAIAEACALAPYLAPCEPENPPPFYPPDVRDDYRLPIPADPARR